MPKQYKNNKSGYKGVSWCKKTNKWKAQITFKGKVIYLGCNDDPKEAYRLYLDFIKNNKEESRLNSGLDKNLSHRLWYHKNHEKGLLIKKKYRDKNQDKASEYHKKKKYNLTNEEYENMLDKANNVCEICGKINRRLCIDHDHTTGKVRGILCDKCNTGIGFLNDDINIINKSAQYLSSHKGIEYEY